MPVKIKKIEHINKKRNQKGCIINLFIAQWEPLTVGRHEIRIQLDGEYLAPQNILTPETLHITQSDINLTRNSLIVNVLDLSAVHIIGLRKNGFVGVCYDFQRKLQKFLIIFSF